MGRCEMVGFRMVLGVSRKDDHDLFLYRLSLKKKQMEVPLRLHDRMAIEKHPSIEAN